MVYYTLSLSRQTDVHKKYSWHTRIFIILSLMFRPLSTVSCVQPDCGKIFSLTTRSLQNFVQKSLFIQAPHHFTEHSKLNRLDQSEIQFTVSLIRSNCARNDQNISSQSAKNKQKVPKQTFGAANIRSILLNLKLCTKTTIDSKLLQTGQ